jgi:para-nitrobenzyl esterase
VPVLIGYTAAETTVLAHAPNAFDLDWASLPAALGPSVGGAAPAALIAEMRRLRPGATAADIYFTVTTERALGEPCRLLAERKAAQASAGAYLYRLDFQTPVDRLRAAHGLDVPLVFDNVARSPSLFGGAAAQAQAVSDAMAGAWIAFARTGSPNAAGLPSWPRYDARARSTMVFGETSRAISDPNGAERALIEALP